MADFIFFGSQKSQNAPDCRELGSIFERFVVQDIPTRFIPCLNLIWETFKIYFQNFLGK